MSAETHVAETDSSVEAVDALLTFATELFADMGGDTWGLQIYFGDRDEASGLPIHRVGIDGTWWVEFDQGAHLEVSAHTVGTPASDVARWIECITAGRSDAV